jgi:hypothetical protein
MVEGALMHARRHHTRAARILVLASLFSALGVVIRTSGPADAAGPSTWCVSQNAAADCRGYAPANRKANLTAAVRAARPGDAIDVYPGTYTDRPNINKANLQITGVQGPETTTLASAAPMQVTAANVTLSGITTSSGIDAGSTPINGNFTLRNFHADNNRRNSACTVSHTCYGVWVIASGNIILDSGTANGNGSTVACSGDAPDPEHAPGPDGETCFGILAQSTGGNVSVKNVTTNNNGVVGTSSGTCSLHETCFGTMLDETAGNVNVTNLTANGNGSSGDCLETGGSHMGDFCFGVAADGTVGNVNMVGVKANDNGATGVCTNTGNHNGDPCNGIIVDGDDNSTGGLTLKQSEARRNGALGPNSSCRGNDSCSGIIIDGVGGNVILDGVKADDNGATLDCQSGDQCAGILTDPSDVTGNFTLQTVEANNNGAGRDCLGTDACFGILEDVGGTTGDHILKSVTTNNNGAGRDCLGSDECFGLLIDGGDFGTGNAVLQNVTATNNSARRNCVNGSSKCFGVSMDGVLGKITGSAITASNNRAGGSCTSTSQACFGMLAESDGHGNITLSQVTTSQNGAVGTCAAGISEPSCFGFQADTTTEPPVGPPGPGDVSLKRVTANQNSGDGVIVNASGRILFGCVTARGNGGTSIVTNKPPLTQSCAGA